MMIKYSLIMHIGVFDSGIGGEAIAAVLRKSFPHTDITCVNDHNHMPYGQREPADIIKLTKLAITPLIKIRCDVIVIACNTATTIAISDLRQSYPKVVFIGIEPMLKPASKITKTKCVCVCATPRTLESPRYQELKRTWLSNIKVVEPDCSVWATLIEKNKLNEIKLDSLIKAVSENNADVIVLGCTHYNWIKQYVSGAVGPGITILEPSETISRRIKNIFPKAF